MKPFAYTRATSLQNAIESVDHTASMALGGGTTLLDLMKLNVLTPERLVFTKPVLDDSVSLQGNELRIGAACTMADVAADSRVITHFPALRQSLILAASPQIRNMATIGGNLLQRTRSPYFRHSDMPDDAEVADDASDAFGAGADTSCLAILGHNGRLVGTYPGDFAITVVAFDGTIELMGSDGNRRVAARDFYTLPNSTSHYVPDLKPGELITSVLLPIDRVARNSFYFKVRDRSSYAFALASASVGLDLDGRGNNAMIRSARVGLGGLAAIPWHSAAAVRMLEGNRASDENFAAAADAALADARPPVGAQYKVDLAKRTLVRALRVLRDQGPLDDDALWALQHGRS